STPRCRRFSSLSLSAGSDKIGGSAGVGKQRVPLTGGGAVSRIRYRVAVSLDGYIAGPKGEFDWIVPEPTTHFGEQFAPFDTFLVGRRTFDLMNKPGSPPLPSGSKLFVFSRTLQNDYPGATVIAEVSPSAIARIKAQAKKDIWLFGGGELFRSLLDRALVD